jgi:hypothetical protein
MLMLMKCNAIKELNTRGVTGVVIRDKVPVLTHWKEYKKDDQHYKNFVGKLSVSALLFI